MTFFIVIINVRLALHSIFVVSFVIVYDVLLSQVLFTCEKSGQLWSVCAWDPHTGTSLMSYRGSSAEPRTLCLVRDDYIVNAVINKPLINVWPMQRKVGPS